MRSLGAVLLVAVALMFGGPSLSAASSGLEEHTSVETASASGETRALGSDPPSGDVGQILAALASRIQPLSQAAGIRRGIANATFCLPQNVLAILCYALLELSGGVRAVADGGGVRLVAISHPFGVSFGRYIFVGEVLLSDRVVAHELGHTVQSYRQGPFYLPAEGLVSFVQAALSLVSPSFARGYLDRWPENEADEIGKTILLPPAH